MGAVSIDQRLAAEYREARQRVRSLLDDLDRYLPGLVHMQLPIRSLGEG